METHKPPESLDEKSTEELIRILQEKKRKLLMMQYASKDLEVQQAETQKLVIPQNQAE
jgi:hypothetical protein